MADQGPKNEFIRGPKWRTRTTPARRVGASVVTFVPILVVGGVLLLSVTWLLDRLGAPAWVVVLPWLAPTLGVLAWTLRAPSPAVATDDDDESWTGYAIRWVMVGGDERRPMTVRVAAAVLFGAPLGWALLLWGLATLSGIV